jgi:hypothetical protein
VGYHTEFSGSIGIEPALSQAEREYLMKFSGTRRMQRTRGPYFVDGTGAYGQDHEADVLNHNSPPDGQPELWCHWAPSADGKSIEWNGGEKFYSSPEWMLYLIRHFLAAGALATGKVPGIVGGHVLNGEIKAQGEEHGDNWLLRVRSNKVFVCMIRMSPDNEKEVR